MSVESVSLNESTIEPNEQARLTAVVENSGAANGSYTVGLEVADTELQTETVAVAAGDQQTIEFTQSFAAAGVYELSVDDEQVSLLVEESDDTVETPTNASTDETEETIPGFGPITALGALLVSVAAAWIHCRDTPGTA